MAGQRKDRTIFRVLLVPLLSVLAIEMALLIASLALGGVMTRLNQNTRDILGQQVENRGNYLLNDMTGKWSNLNLLVDHIDNEVASKLSEGEMTLESFQVNGGCSELLEELRPELIDAMYNRQVSGIFLIFNTKDLDEMEGTESLQGIYLRDLDPASMPSAQYQDILVERAPVSVVRSGYMATDTGWQPTFSVEDSVEQDFFSKPFQTAYEDEKKLNDKEYGYWTTEFYSLSGDSHRAMAYSMPLILSDGTVYGVLGVEILEDYLYSLLPGGELMEMNQGSYLLAISEKGSEELKPVFLSSATMTQGKLDGLQFFLDGESGNSVSDAGGEYCGAATPLVLYSRNAPFDSDKWYLVGFGRREHLFAFSKQIQTVLGGSFVLTALIGLVGILLVSYRLSKPIRMLSEEVEKAKMNNAFPMLPDTGIREIDQFSHAIERLEQEVMDSSQRFMQIISMASVDLAGYELWDDSDSVFVTANYFPLLGVEDMDLNHLTAESFLAKQEELRQSLKSTPAEDGSVVYSIPLPQGETRYIRAESTRSGKRLVGVIEDVTTSTLEKMQIERERDCDGLTKLYGRRGFRREADEMFLRPELLKQAALLMIDLDNLKTTNDRFGHNFGDLYIQTAGKCFLENTPDNTICARISGDEFLVLFYGYNEQEEIRRDVQSLYRAIGEVKFVLPNGDNMGLSASGGVAWYPQDSEDLSELMKYADFAMYQVKRSVKGQLKEFNLEAYQEKMRQNQSRLEFHQMLENKQVSYHFQPIFAAGTGEVYAYEALMRVDFPALRSPETVLQIAKEENCMHDIEYMTMFCACEDYQKLLERGEAADHAFLFINSIANERMTLEEEQEFHERFAQIQPKVVVEITEVEHMDMDMVRQKRDAAGFSGNFALDDYGSGYNSEINLLELEPKYVKVDITIVRDIDKDRNKQHIVENIVHYAHERDMKVIMEGLETAAELQKSLELGVDLLQGYFLARPGAVPPAISDGAKKVLQEQFNVSDKKLAISG